MKKILFFTFIFIFIFLFNLFLVPNNMDELWNYGFSLAIRMGEIPYNDFNMVVPPFYPLLMSIPLFIYKNYLSFVIFHSLLITTSLFFAYKMYGDRTALLFITSMFLLNCIYPTYNSFSIFLIIILLYLENSKFDNKDLLVGLLISILFLTKQSTGIVLLIPWFIKYKDVDLKKRIIGFLIPLLICLLYLLINNNLYNFIDQCFLGLIDFSGNYKSINYLCFFLFLFIFLFSITVTFKKKNDITNLYIIMSYIIFIPTFDTLHFQYSFFLFVLFLINNFEFKRINFKLIFICLFIGINIISIYKRYSSNIGVYPNNFNNLNTKYYPSNGIKYITSVNECIKDDYIIFDETAYLYRIINNQKVTYLDLVNHGNLGFNSSEKFIEELKKNKDRKILVSDITNELTKNYYTQLDRDVYLYIIKHYKVVDKCSNFSIYEFDK